MRKFISHTIFNPVEKDWKPDKILAVLFHRSAATLYFVYFLWALFSSIFGKFPSAIQGQGDFVAYVFSLIVIPTAGLAFLGATYFPKFARLEMYAAASLVSLFVIYEAFILVTLINNGSNHFSSLVLNVSYLVIPVARIIFTYICLVKQAGDT